MSLRSAIGKWFRRPEPPMDLVTHLQAECSRMDDLFRRAIEQRDELVEETVRQRSAIRHLIRVVEKYRDFHAKGSYGHMEANAALRHAQEVLRMLYEDGPGTLAEVPE